MKLLLIFSLLFTACQTKVYDQGKPALLLGSGKAKELADHMPVAYAVTYIWGTIGTGM